MKKIISISIAILAGGLFLVQAQNKANNKPVEKHNATLGNNGYSSGTIPVAEVDSALQL